jgi:NAD(P) transhydrogenase subunit alpha
MVPYHMYARNLTTFLTLLVKEGKMQLKLRDDIIRETLVTRGGDRQYQTSVIFLSAGFGATGGRNKMKLDLLTGLYVFMLAAFIGFEVIRRVSPLLHTPLMSLTNALDAIAVVGAIILAGEHKSNLAAILGTIGIVAATSNVVGGFIITDGMLKMFKSSGPKK